MRLKNLTPEAALGHVLAHSQSVPAADGIRRLKKGQLLTAEDTKGLRQAGLDEITVAVLADDDINEDVAASRVAEHIAGEHIRLDPPHTGRCNLYAKKDGLSALNVDEINRLNGLNPAITVATLNPAEPVRAGQMIATVKIIPFAVPEAEINSVCSTVPNTVSVAPFTPKNIGLLATSLPSLKSTTMDKTRKVIEARLAASQSSVGLELRVPHNVEDTTNAITQLANDSQTDLIILFGASAMIDGSDVLPQALRNAGGSVTYLGMPVDPGNLLFIGHISGKPVIGAPGCARSPAENGFDWILNRFLAGVTVDGAEIARMGVGGLLKEIVSRPQPRQARTSVGKRKRVDAIILAAGRSTRMGPHAKLLARLDDKPLVQHVLEAICEADFSSVVLVTGAEDEPLRQIASGFPVRVTHNPNFADGMSTSLKAGLAVIRGQDELPHAILVALGDMPHIASETLNRLIDAFQTEEGAEIIVPTHDGSHGNPVLWSTRFLEELCNLTGDKGGRELIAAHADFVRKVEIGPEVAFDIDTPEQLAAAGGMLENQD